MVEHRPWWAFWRQHDLIRTESMFPHERITAEEADAIRERFFRAYSGPNAGRALELRPAPIRRPTPDIG